MTRILVLALAATAIAAAAHAGPRSGGETKALSQNGTAVTGTTFVAPATVTGIDLPS